MKLLILNGPNLNMLGIREPELYGAETYAQLCEKIKEYCITQNIETKFLQTNHEGTLVDAIQQAYFDGMDGIVLNPGAYTHTSIALLDTVRAVPIPVAEVHITDIAKREPFRAVSYVREAVVCSVIGHGTDGYLEAIDFLRGAYHAKDNS